MDLIWDRDDLHYAPWRILISTITLLSSSRCYNPAVGNWRTAVTVWPEKAEVSRLWCRKLPVTPPSAERGSVFGLSRRRACTRWKTAPRAGWLFAPSRPTPTATASWRLREARRGCGGTWRNVLSACRRGEPAQPWAGKGTLQSWKGRHEDDQRTCADGRWLPSKEKTTHANTSLQKSSSAAFIYPSLWSLLGARTLFIQKIFSHYLVWRSVLDNSLLTWK